ncbi:MAG TPA: ABC transporter substrate-binding protein [Actinomycetota bacterium]|nr:ABC transporter substrate-binding protein [Actinomycetota bacterium]
MTWRRIATTFSVLALIAAACGGPETRRGGEPVTLTFVSFGGAYQQAQTNAWLEPFMKANPNVRIVQEEPTDYAKLQAMVESGNVTWDVVEVGNDFGLASDHDVLEPIDCKIVPCDELQSDLFPTRGYRVPDIVYSVVVGYRSDAFAGKQPTSFADFFDLKKFPGKRGAFNYASWGLLEMALLADGVQADELYPLDLDRAFAKLDTVKDQIVWYDSGAQSAQLLADGEVAMGMSWNGRIFDIQREGAPVDIMWDQHILTADYLVVPKGSKNVRAAMQLISWIVSDKNNAEISKHIAYAPANEGAVNNVDRTKERDLPTSYVETGIGFNDVWWDENFDAVDRRWQEWLQT